MASDRIGSFPHRFALISVGILALAILPSGCGDDSDPVTPTLKITAEITAPIDGTRFLIDQDIDFAGTGSDTGDQPLTGASLVWTSSLDGRIGEGESFSASLDLGEHTITLTATDAQDRSGTASIDVRVVPLVSVTISLPTADGAYDETTEVECFGSAFDSDGIAIIGEDLVWSSDRDGDLGIGAAISVILSEGQHTITLTATDDQDRTGSASVQITVAGDGM